MDSELICKYYDEGKSVREVASIFGTYPNKIARILQKAGKPLRSRSEAGKEAVKNGRLRPPMLGKKRTKAERENISQKRAKKWAEMDSDDREKFRLQAKERWDNQTDEERLDKQQKAGQALRKAAKEGSKLEKYLNEQLTLAGFNVIMHKTGLIPGDKYEIDLYLPDIPAAIEVDGPQHFKPFYGEAELRDSVRYDATKTGVLITKGICVIRIKYMSKHNSIFINKKAFLAVKEKLDSISKNFPKLEDMLIELEVGDGG